MREEDMVTMVWVVGGGMGEWWVEEGWVEEGRVEEGRVEESEWVMWTGHALVRGRCWWAGGGELYAVETRGELASEEVINYEPCIGGRGWVAVVWFYLFILVWRAGRACAWGRLC